MRDLSYICADVMDITKCAKKCAQALIGRIEFIYSYLHTAPLDCGKFMGSLSTGLTYTAGP